MNDTAVPARTLVFIGDSITDAGRREDPEHLGFGYVRLIAEHFAAHEPDARVLNTGIGGNRVPDLVARFGPDCVDLAPDVVTLYVGVNDTWRRYDSDDPTSVEDFEAGYRYLLDQLSGARPGVPVLLILPFVADIDEEKARFHEDLAPKVARIRALAREFGHPVVDSEHLLERAYAAGHTPATIAEDGVHPTIAGHRLLADAWLEAFATVDPRR
ncbi:SGNH/GDSL hydrolase family protein [Brachybacterium kimchii]|uniref:SGNH/GDSL hydrolase family protein n=1 Tax=Brachybacterium kimchii TaxID=2942909 RepID=A0ABY4N7U8_9MICO|nr:SGNH/GDSL hydrolase family protein [Brachybacterium kimchii]UQN30189.1 SGNH/GDSL hydrolase family protein [Brachybacterium kimchii]